MEDIRALCLIAAYCILSSSIGLLSPALAAPKGESAKPVVQAAAKPQVDWRTKLKLTEQLIVRKVVPQAASYYTEAIQGAEAARVSCSDPMFLELMAVGKELSVAITGLEPDKQMKDAVETALQWKIHAATAICGKDSPAEYEAYECMVGWCVLRNQQAAGEYQKKATQLLSKLMQSGTRMEEVRKFQKAGKDRATRFLGVEMAKVTSQLDQLSKQTQQRMQALRSK